MGPNRPHQPENARKHFLIAFAVQVLVCFLGALCDPLGNEEEMTCINQKGGAGHAG